MIFKERIKRLSPPGRDQSGNIAGFFILLLLAVLFTLAFPARFNNALGRLYVKIGGEKHLLKDAVMESINYLLRGCFFGIWLVLAYCASWVRDNYRSLYKETKSIYVMKRLKTARETHLRCLALPAAGMLLALTVLSLLLALYVNSYYSKTPASCLPAREALKIWRILA